MQLHQLSPKTKQKKEKRIGRGGKRGTYSGRGIKGQKARAGHKIRPQERDILKKIPKLRGYKFKSFRPKPAIVNLGEFKKAFKPGEIVNPETLWKIGLVSKIKGIMPKVKILGKGKLDMKLSFKDVKFSKSAAKNIAINSKPKLRV